MIDGHSGIENREVNRGGSGNFQLVLAYLKESSGAGHFVIHATSSTSYSYGLQPLEFLQQIGFTHFRGECPFHHDRCFYREIATLQRDIHGFENMQQVQSIHDAFRKFAEKIGDLFSLYQQEERVLREIELTKTSASLFGAPLEIEIQKTDMPLWIEDVKPKRLLNLQKQFAELKTEIDDLKSFLPLVYATGDILVEAVLQALRFSGLKAERTQPGFTVDILVQTIDSSKRFGFEVTGAEGGIKKESKKLTQVLEFERIKEHGEKTVLLANTFRLLPIQERNNCEHFTPQVIDFLSRHPILLMTGWDLYRMVCDILEGSKNPEDIIDLIFRTEGRLEYE